MKKLSNKKINKTFRDNLITYGMVIAAYVIMQILVSAGSVSSLIQGLLVPLCTYAILAVSLNLTVGILGELSLGHAGFMCIGAFTSAFFSKVMENSAMPSGLRFFFAILIGAFFAGVFGLLIGIPVLRLKGDYLAIVTLAFGEIIKNLVNIMFVGRDENGFHISFTNTMDLNMSEDTDHHRDHGACQELHQGCSSDFFRGTLFLWISQSPVFSDPGHHFHNILGKLKLH